jgi:hypothetical protein
MSWENVNVEGGVNAISPSALRSLNVWTMTVSLRLPPPPHPARETARISAIPKSSSFFIASPLVPLFLFDDPDYKIFNPGILTKVPA